MSLLLLLLLLLLCVTLPSQSKASRLELVQRWGSEQVNLNHSNIKKDNSSSSSSSSSINISALTYDIKFNTPDREAVAVLLAACGLDVAAAANNGGSSAGLSFRNPLTMVEQLQYKYILSIEGADKVPPEN